MIWTSLFQFRHCRISAFWETLSSIRAMDRMNEWMQSIELISIFPQINGNLNKYDVYWFSWFLIAFQFRKLKIIYISRNWWYCELLENSIYMTTFPYTLHSSKTALFEWFESIELRFHLYSTEDIWLENYFVWKSFWKEKLQWWNIQLITFYSKKKTITIEYCIKRYTPQWFAFEMKFLKKNGLHS